MANGTPVAVSPAQRTRLLQLARRPKEEARMALRAKIILLLDEGKSNVQVARQTGIRPATVSKWRNRFVSEGLDGLGDDFRPGRPPVYDRDDIRRRVEVKLAEAPPPGFGRWNGRLLAEALGDIPAGMIWKIMRMHGIQLQRRRSWCQSTDPEFARKACEVIGLYLAPPENAIVLSVDEKPCIQALERAQGWLKLPNGRALTGYAHEYKRHGTTTLFAALDVMTGRVVGKCAKRKRRQEFVKFINELENQHPEGELHLILDNLSTHKITAPQWWKKHPRLHFHFTPTHSSWLNQIETWFSIFSRQSLAGSSHNSVAELIEHIENFIVAYNQNCAPFIWRKVSVSNKPMATSYADLNK